MSDPLSAPLMLRIAVSGSAGPASMDVTAETEGEMQPAQITIRAARGDSAASVTLSVGIDGRGGIAISTKDLTIDAETLSISAEQADLSASAVNLAAAECNLISDDLRILGKREVEMSGKRGILAFISGTLGAVKQLLIRSRNIQIMAGNAIRLTAPRLDARCASGNLGSGAARGIAREGDPVIVMTAEGPANGRIVRGSTRWRCAD